MFRFILFSLMFLLSIPALAGSLPKEPPGSVQVYHFTQNGYKITYDKNNNRTTEVHTEHSHLRLYRDNLGWTRAVGIYNGHDSFFGREFVFTSGIEDTVRNFVVRNDIDINEPLVYWKPPNVIESYEVPMKDAFNITSFWKYDVEGTDNVTGCLWYSIYSKNGSSNIRRGLSTVLQSDSGQTSKPSN